MEENVADAAQRQDWHKVGRLVTRGDDVNKTANSVYHRRTRRRTALHYATFRDKVAVCELLLERGADINVTDDKGDQPLHRAAAGNSVAVCQLLFDHGAEINAMNKYGDTPLHKAARGRPRRGCPGSCEVLLKRGAKVDAVNKYGQTPLHLVCEKGYAETGCLLLSYGADVRAVDHDGYPPLLLISRHITHSRKGIDAQGNHALHIASRDGMFTAVQLLVDLGANVNALNKEGQTPLHYSAAAGEKGSSELCEILLKRGAKVNAIDKYGQQPLHLACENGDAETGCLLLSHGADVRAIDHAGDTPLLLMSQHTMPSQNEVDTQGNHALHIACRDGTSTAVQLLVDLGADTNAMNKLGQTPLHTAAAGKKACPELCEILLKREANVNAMDKYGQQPLHLACENGDAETGCLLLSHDADGRAVDRAGHPPLFLISQHIMCQKGVDTQGNHALHIASSNGMFTAVQLLVDLGADTNAMNLHGQTPLHAAADRKDYPELCEILLKHAAKINAVDEDGCQPLHLACKQGHTSTGSLLLSHGADTNAVNVHGQAPLHVVTDGKKDCPELCEILLKHAAKIDAVDGDGNQPLHLACKQGHTNTCSLLLSHGADRNAANIHGQTPLHMAAGGEKDCPELCEILLEHAARIDAVNKDKSQPLHLACSRGHRNTGSLLLSHGADTNAVNKHGQTPLHVVAGRGIICQDVCKILLEHGAQLDVADKDGKQPLHVACEKGISSHYTCEILLKHGAQLDATDRDGKQPLHIASERGSVTVGELLLSWGADVQALDPHGVTPNINKLLLAAVKNGCISACQLFLEKGANPNYTEDGLQPLTIAAKKTNTELCNLLLGKGATIPIDGSKQLGGALRHAIEWNMNDLTKLLLSHGVNIRHAHIGQQTVLERSKRTGTRDMAQLLHAAGTGNFVNSKFQCVVHLGSL